MDPQWVGIIVTGLIAMIGIYVGLRKQPAEIRTMDSTALKNSTEVNEMLSAQMLEMQRRVDTLEKTNRGPFRLTVEFSTGESPRIHKAELVLIK